jgi:glycosyltransferase involved in cell wall biosynthesis
MPFKIALIAADGREDARDYTALRPSFGAATEALLQGFASLPEVEIHVVSCAQKPMKSPEKLAENIWFHGVYAPKLGWQRASYQGCIRAARRQLKAIRPEIVHGLGTERECAISAAFSKFPNVVTIFQDMTEQARLLQPRLGSTGWLAGQLENITLKRTRGILCSSEYSEKLAKPRAQRAWRVPNAIREEFFAPVRLQPAADKCILLNAGDIAERQRQTAVLAVARKLHRQGLKFELRFIGNFSDDDYVKIFKERLVEAEAAGYARHIGSKTTAEIVDCYDSAHGLLHCPSDEASGFVVPEALARNLKFFGTGVGGVIEITAGVPDAELFSLEDWDGLTLAITRWMRAGYPRSSHAAAGMAPLVHPAAIARRHVEIYREALNTSR